MYLDCRKYFICRWIDLRTYLYLQKYEMKEGFNPWVTGVCVGTDPSNNNELLSEHYCDNGGTEDFRKRHLFRRIDMNKALYEEQKLKENIN
jgi:hypothetical protein